MAAPTTNLARAFLGLSEKDGSRKDALTAEHPRYTERVTSWNVFKDAYEGDGGFLTGAYLWKFPNEIPDDYLDRQEQARYHNYSRELVEIYTGHIFSKTVTRTTTNAQLADWWENVDGNGTNATEYMRRAVTLALAVGHVGILVDKTRDEALGPAKADERATVVARTFLPQAILDWRLPDGDLRAVKLRELVENDDLSVSGDERESSTILLWTDTEWARFDEDSGDLMADGMHGLGVCPFFVVRPIPSATWPFIGSSLFGSANLFKALYNRASEEDQTLRNQAFSTLTVNVPVDGDVKVVKDQIGKDLGTMRALVVTGEADYITPAMEAPEQIRTNIEHLVREIHRLAMVQHDSNSKEAESAEAISLKHRKLNDRLTAVVGDMERVETQMAKAWFGWNSASAMAAESAFESSETTIGYAREFFISDMLAELEKWAKALSMRLGETYEKHIRKVVVRQLSPNLDAQILDDIDAEIDAAKQEQLMTPADQMKAAAAARLQAMTGAKPDVVDPQDPQDA